MDFTLKPDSKHKFFLRLPGVFANVCLIFFLGLWCYAGIVAELRIIKSKRRDLSVRPSDLACAAMERQGRVSYRASVWVCRLTTVRSGPPRNPAEESDPHPSPQEVPQVLDGHGSGPLRSLGPCVHGSGQSSLPLR